LSEFHIAVYQVAAVTKIHSQQDLLNVSVANNGWQTQKATATGQASHASLLEYLLEQRRRNTAFVVVENLQHVTYINVCFRS